MWILFAFLSAIFAGITSILAKIGIKNTDSHLATALRTVIILAFSWLMVIITGAQRDFGNLTSRTLVFLVLSGLATGASWICYFRALQLGNVNKVVPIDKSSTILTMILAFLLLGEPVTVLMGIGILVIGTGTYLMIEKKDVVQNESGSRMWLLYGILSAVFASLTSILGKIGVQDIDSNLGTAIRTIVVLLMAWLIVFGFGKQREISKIDLKSWIFIALSGLTTGLSWLFYYRALKDGLASIVVPIDKLSILFTVFLARILLKERLTRKSLIGLGMISAGTLLLLF